MRKIVLALILSVFSICSPITAKSDSLRSAWDSMDKIHDTLQKQSNELEQKIAEAQKKIDDAKAKKERKPNYWIPIAGGALLGIALAWWLRRKKNG